LYYFYTVEPIETVPENPHETKRDDRFVINPFVNSL